MKLKILKTSVLITAIATAITLSAYSPARAESRWDGFSTGTFNNTPRDFGFGLDQQTAQKERDLEYDFNEKKTYENQYKTKSFEEKVRENVRERLIPRDRNR